MHYGFRAGLRGQGWRGGVEGGVWVAPPPRTASTVEERQREQSEPLAANPGQEHEGLTTAVVAAERMA